MFEPNVQKLLKRLGPEDLVLDVGGWACPFNRAQWVIDAEPYETRGFYRTFGGPASQGGEVEWFSAETWVRRDLCGRDPWPFGDRQFDFAVCSHVLEDVRDPLWVCSELMRVSRSGYIETPSRVSESCRGLESPGFVGLSHHRWLVEYVGDRIEFRMKPHFVHESFRYAFPKRFGERLPPERHVDWLWWDDRFEFEEIVVHGTAAMRSEAEQFIARHYRYSKTRHAMSFVLRLVQRLGRGVRRRLLSNGG